MSEGLRFAERFVVSAGRRAGSRQSSSIDAYRLGDWDEGLPTWPST